MATANRRLPIYRLTESHSSFVLLSTLSNLPNRRNAIAGTSASANPLDEMKKVYFSILFFWLCIACNSKSKETVIPGIPIDTTKSSRHDVVEALPGIAVKLGLPAINGGVDSFTYRFWFPIEEDTNDGMTVIDISYINDAWKATKVDYWGHKPEHEIIIGDTTNYYLRYIVDSVRKRELISKALLASVVNKISQLNLQNGPSQSSLEINEYTSYFSRYLEFASPSTYRTIHIACNSKQSQIPFYRKIKELEHLIREQFAVKIMRCAESNGINK